MSGADHRLSNRRLIRRSAVHHRGQTVLIMLLSAFISASVIFAAGYSRQAQQAIVDATLASDRPGNVWSLTGRPGSNLSALLPSGFRRLTEEPVAGRVSDITWNAPRFASSIIGTLAWRADVCRHLVVTSGRCPSEAAEVAVSAADASTFRVRTGDQLEQQVNGSVVRLKVSAIYRPRDPADPYWFGNPPIGRSGFDTSDQPRSDELIAGSDRFKTGGYLETLQVRIDHSAVRTADLAELNADTVALAESVRGRSSLVTSVPASLGQISTERSRFAAGLALTLAQLGVLIVVVLALLASVALSDQRRAVGLGRLRGESARSVFRLVVAHWAALITAGWLLGWVPGLLALATAANILPGQHGLSLGAGELLASLLAWSVMVAVIVPGTRSMLAQPAISLLQGVRRGGRADRGRQLLIDTVLVITASAGLLVAVQAGAVSTLGLLVPSLLAVAVGVLLVRAVVLLARAGRRKLSRGRVRPSSLLTAVLLARLQGLKTMVVLTCIAVAIAVFAVQVEAIGAAVRRHQAEVSGGAPVVLQVDGQPAAVVDAVDQLDPRHGTPHPTLTPVVLTRRSDSTALRGMFVDPASFVRIALGADRVTDLNGWHSISAPQLDAVNFTGGVVTTVIAAHPELGGTSTDLPTRTGTSAELGVDYLDADGSLQTASLGRLRLAAGPDQRFSKPVSCQSGCRLLRITFAPNGPMRGRIRLSSFGVERSGIEYPVDLQSAARWQPVSTFDPYSQLKPQDGPGALSFLTESAGGQLAVQHAWLPAALPVLLAADVQPETYPTLAAPDGSPLPIRPVARAQDAIPGELAGVAVGDLAAVLRAGHPSATQKTTVQIWVAPESAGRLGDLTRALAARDLRVISAVAVRDALTAQRTSASALTGQIAPWVAILAAVFGALGIGLTVAGQRDLLGQDLAALWVAGVGRPTLRRAVMAAYLLPGLLAVLLGALVGSVGCALVVSAMPLLPTVQPAIRIDLNLRPVPLAACVLIALGVLTVALAAGLGWLMRGSRADRVRGIR